MMTMLESLRDALAGVPGVQSCKVGLEDNITPDDYPIIRIVPSQASAVDEDMDVYAVHFPFPGLGRIKRQGEGFAWAPDR